MYYDPHYPTILPTLIALALVLVLNIVVPISACFIARLLGRHKWLPHAFALLWVLTSVFNFYLIGMPNMASDEEAGAGGGFLVLPILLEMAVVFIAYFFSLAWLLFSDVAGRNASS